jgi:hypothetical protein
VFEHPGEATFPVSCLVVKRGGMVVFCAGTSGYNITFDARYVWMRQKRVQGSHFAHLKQASAANQFVLDRRVDPCMSEVFPWAKIPHAHELMHQPASARQHGGAGQRAAHGAAHAGRCAGGEWRPFAIRMAFSLLLIGGVHAGLYERSPRHVRLQPAQCGSRVLPRSATSSPLVTSGPAREASPRPRT